jgi:hypothetical protein
MHFRIACFISPFAICQQHSGLLSVRDVKELGLQENHKAIRTSREGGHSVLINGRVVWLYDNTKQLGKGGTAVSHRRVSAAYSTDPDKRIRLIEDISLTSNLSQLLDSLGGDGSPGNSSAMGILPASKNLDREETNDLQGWISRDGIAFCMATSHHL